MQIGQVFEQNDVNLHNAKITTLGEKAEDVFFITTEQNMPLDEQHCAKLVSIIEQTLSHTNA